MIDEWASILARAIVRRALTAILLMGLVAVLGYSVDQAGWVREVQWGPGAWLALLGGAALARARWQGQWAFGYSVVLMMAGAAELVGHVVPDPAGLWQTPGDWVWNLHLRTVALGLRLQAWNTAIAHGRPVGDTGLFVWLMALLVWGVAAWLAWGVVRRRQALGASLPAALVLAVNTVLSAQPWQELLLFLVLLIALMIETTYLAQNADWDRRGVDYPDDLGLDWGTAAAGLLLSIGLVTAAAPVVATSHGWQFISDLLASSRQQVASTANQLFTGVKPPSGSIPEPVARTPDLTNIGGAIDQSASTVMWVKLDEAPPANYPGAPPPPQHYWRSGLYATYTGAGWQPVSLAPGSSAGQLPDPLPPGRYALREEFQIVAEHGQAQFAVNQPISATSGALVAVDEADIGTALLAGPAANYAVTSLATRVSQAELRAAGTAYPDVIRAANLQLPASLPARVAGLAAQIASGADNPYDRAVRLQDYLRRTYAYRLDVPPPPAGRDAVDYFLYEAPGGYCSYYASALAVMLRTLGVPARIATGYAMGEYDATRGAYRVAGAAAHAWVEVYFPSYGWVEFEPTPARAVFERPAGQAGATATPAVPPPTGQATAPLAPQTLAVAIGVAGLLLAFGGWVGWQLAARRQPATPRARVLWHYGRMRSALSNAGLGAAPSVTADEFLLARSEALSNHPLVLAALTETTKLFRAAAYSPHPVSDADARLAQHLWAQARLAWVGLTITRLAQRWRGSHTISP